MKSNPIQDILSSIGLSFPGNNLLRKYADEQAPLRSDLFSTDQMEQYGKTLAGKHKLSIGRAPNSLLKRLAENEEVLLEVHQLLTEAVKANRRIIPAGEWLLDNFYLIQEQIRTGKKHLPKGYNEDLPRLLSGPSAGLPRVYDIAIEIISHSDGRVDVKSLISFIKAYQAVTPLKLGELWAIPIMLRLALIENLRRLTAQIAIDRITQNLADYWAEQMTETAEKDPKSLILVIADMARSAPPMVSSFVAELTRQLQGKGPALALPLTWIEQRLLETGQTSNELVNAEIQKQAADQVSMSNSIGSLRFLGTTDWREFVETTSIVEQTLREDVGGAYAGMDFSTRDSYRHVVEEIAKNGTATEQEVAGIASRFAKEYSEKNGLDDRAAHIGYWLVGKGLPLTEKAAGFRPFGFDLLQKTIRKFSLFTYLGLILVSTLIVAGGLFAKAYSDGIRNWLLVVISILSLLSASQLAVTIVNWVITLLIKPKLLPRMDFSSGIPSAYRTLVVVPTILSDDGEIEHLTEMLEVHFLANKDEHLHFGLLTDFKDAPLPVLPEDESLLQQAEQKIKELNSKYGSVDNDIFYLFHRPRKFNSHDRQWMGYERKRGKLTELNALLRGKGDDFFSSIVGDQSIFSTVKYVITIDSDTQLPRDSARKIVATMAHPLNHAFYDEKKQRVTEGYGILQPRVTMSLPGQNNSLYAHMHGSDAGIDPYTRTTSDVYQDLFDEGSFIGKGIYNVDIFSKALDGRFPENRILSHDLLEGGYTRSGLVSDEQFYEEYPSSYNADVKRRHRWIRGDWQIATWMLPWVPGADKRLKKNPLPGLMRWKIFDNIRRSLVPSAFVILLSLSWIALPSAWFWTLAVIGILIIPFVIISAWNIFHRPKDISLKQHFKDSVQSITNNFLQLFFSITCLPYEAFYTFDAIVRTNWRMIVSHKHLLEWNPSHNFRDNLQKTLWPTYLTMLVAPLVGWTILIYLLIYSPLSQIVASPVLILWIISPAVAWVVSRPFKKKEINLTAEQTIFLRKLARKTWAFFENFVGKEDNWLPPDNYQEHPVDRIAHRTSPTNIGLSLLANLSATDFVFITTGKFIDRTSNTFATMQTMERYRGHFYNWYDTVTLNTLPPRYISTVDSGNLAGHILTLHQGIVALPDQKILETKMFEGLRDTLALLEDKIRDNSLLQPFRKELEAVISKENPDLQTAYNSVEQLVFLSRQISSGIMDDPDSDAEFWGNALFTQTQNLLDDLLVIFPWLSLPGQLSSRWSVVDKIPTLNQIANLTEADEWTDDFKNHISQSMQVAKERIKNLEKLALQCVDFANLEYDFLYDRSQHLLSIGYNADEHRRDLSYYDLLASEARLCTFVGIAQGKLPQESWFALGRQLTNAGGTSVLLSWSGSMFEYLMPLLVMPTHDDTLLDQTNHATVQRQIEYGHQCDIPWGISESGYNMVDASLNYQYRAFGVPGLGLKRGLAEDLVIAPYATMMALMVKPEAACENLQRLSKEGFESTFGFFEAVDYTPSRLPRGQSNVIVRSFMAHHQGMGLLSIGYVLLDKPMQKRFENEPQFQATLLLLQERIPKTTGFYTPPDDVAEISVVTNNVEMRVINTPDTPVPEVQLLSNGRYHVMVTSAGGGYSRWKDIAVTRWREDSTCDNWGNFCYIRELEKGNVWSSAFQPTLKQAKSYEAVFSQGRAEFRRRENGIETHTEIVVSPEDDIEIRRVHLTNRSRKTKSFEITSYAEVVLTYAIADTLHPAFSNLFVQTEIIPQRHAILCTRRPRSAEEHLPWMFHLMKVQAENIEDVSFETDRMQFIGRGKTIVDPQAINQSSLSGTQGSVLDPVVA
ncbi:MAG: glycosyltransferase, partial [Chitinophagaceae bacterium]|nr:glycosyltransferase [Chitinophagaceae bacterium]